MTTAKEINMTNKHQIIWNKLRTLPDGERISGTELMQHAEILERRTFFQIIEDMRTLGMFIGAGRSNPKGYYEIRTTTEMNHFLASKRLDLKRQNEVLDNLELLWNMENYVYLYEEKPEFPWDDDGYFDEASRSYRRGRNPNEEL